MLTRTDRLKPVHSPSASSTARKQARTVRAKTFIPGYDATKNTHAVAPTTIAGVRN